MALNSTDARISEAASIECGAHYPTLSRLFSVAGVVLFGTNLIQLLANPEGAAAAVQSGPARYLFLLLYGTSLAGLLAHYTKALRLVAQAPLVLALTALTALAPLSFAWSVVPTETFERSVALLGSTLFAGYLALQPVRQIVQAIGWGFLISAVLSALFAIVLPRYGITQEGPWAGDWKGVHLHKNALGTASAIGVLAMIMASRMAVSPPARWMLLAGAVLSAVLIPLSQSATALVTIVVGLATLKALDLARTRAGGSASLAILLLIPAAGAASYLFGGSIEELLELLGRRSDLTGRIPLWNLLYEYIERRPLFGYGYGAFWNESFPEAQRIAALLRYMPHYSHSGLLEVLLGLGFIGAVLAACVLLSAWLTYLVQFYRRHATEAQLGTVFFAAFLVSNLSEAHVLERNDIYWIIAVVLILRAPELAASSTRRRHPPLGMRAA